MSARVGGLPDSACGLGGVRQFVMERAMRILLSCLIGQVVFSIHVSDASAGPNLELIRVAVVRQDPQIDLQIHGRFTMVELNTGTPLQQLRRLDAVVVRAIPAGLALGEQVLNLSGVRIEPESTAAIRLNGKRLRGTVDIVRQKDLTLLVINYVSLEDYLRGVLSKEAPDYWPAEALKAIAIAARTYAVYQRFTKDQMGYDVTGDVMSQDYGGKTAEKNSTTRAVKATDGWILMYKGQLFPSFYHSTCGGITEHARVMGAFDIEPLKGGVVCSLCAASPFYRWQRRLTKLDVAWALRKSRYGSIEQISQFQVTGRSPFGRAQEVTIIGSQRSLKLTGYDIRALFGFELIRSPFFSVQEVGDSFVLDGRGWGHGVGMCQWGAAELARRGFSAAEILAFYYPGSQLEQIKNIINRQVVVIKGEP